MSTTLLVGTTKGAFILRSDAGRKDWTVTGPHCNGWSINHFASDPATGAIWAGGGGDFFGAGVWKSQDGASWELTRLTSGQMDGWAEQDPDFGKAMGWTGEPLPFGDDFSQIWSLSFAHGKLYAGTKPAQLVESSDSGATWTMNDAIANFPDRDNWNGGAAGMTLHTIVPHPDDPNKIWLGVSAVGVFATEDGGKSWERRNRLSNADLCEGHTHPAAPANGEVGHCVHNMMRAPGDGDTLYQQNHHGVWRSRDGGRSWDDITEGLPSTFGFPMQVHPTNPEMIWTIPLNGDMSGRFPPEAKAAVWRSTDGGENWDDMRTGLPQEGCYFTILRQAMAGDSLDQPGIYFGTNSGSIFASLDEGQSWFEIAEHLPTILTLEVQSRH